MRVIRLRELLSARAHTAGGSFQKTRSGTFAISILMALPGLPSSPTSSSSSNQAIRGAESSKTEEGTGDAEDSTDPVTTRDLPSFSAEQVEQMGMNEKLESVQNNHPVSPIRQNGTDELTIRIILPAKNQLVVKVSCSEENETERQEFGSFNLFSTKVLEVLVKTIGRR